MNALQIVYHPPLDRPAAWPGLDPPRDPARPATWAAWLAVALGLAIFGLALGQAAAVAVGANMPAVALPFSVAGLGVAVSVLFWELTGGCGR